MSQQDLQDQNIELANRITLERNLIIAEAADKAFKQNNGKFEIRMRIPTGNKHTNILGSEEIEFEEGKYETKTFKFRTMSTNDWNLLLRTRAELNNEMDKINSGQVADNIKINDLTTRIYEFLALKFLGMSHDDYMRAEWDDVKLAIEACTFITESGIRDFNTKSNKEKQDERSYIRNSELSVALPRVDEETMRLNSRPKSKPEDSSSKKYYEYEG